MQSTEPTKSRAEGAATSRQEYLTGHQRFFDTQAWSPRQPRRKRQFGASVVWAKLRLCRSEKSYFLAKKWQSCKDSNLNKVNQNHLCYRYTTGLRLFYNIPPDFPKIKPQNDEIRGFARPAVSGRAQKVELFQPISKPLRDAKSM